MKTRKSLSSDITPPIVLPLQLTNHVHNVESWQLEFTAGEQDRMEQLQMVINANPFHTEHDGGQHSRKIK